MKVYTGNSVRPIVTLIFALAKIHINRDYLGAAKTMYKVSDVPNRKLSSSVFNLF